ncbi:MAG: helix-turn-helix domain-containing protein [Geminicoccaceae bacterium]
MLEQARPDDSHGIGAEIREVRKARHLTLKDLSAQVDCSIAYLSRIERGAARISVDLLEQISVALDVDPKWFFPDRSGSGPLERAHVVRANKRRPLSDMYSRSTEELGFEDELLSSSLDGGFYLLISRFPPASSLAEPLLDGYAFEGEQHGIVLEGEILLLLDDEKIVLKKGDSFSYPSTVLHRFRNNGPSEAVMVWAMAPVRISW